MTGVVPLQLSVLWDGGDLCLSNLKYASVSSGKLVESPDSEVALEEYWSKGKNGAPSWLSYLPQDLGQSR